MSPSSHLWPIYAVWDHNAEAMAADIREPGVKVRQWRNRDNIPSDYWPRIVAAAWEKRGVRLELVQFIRAAAVALCGVCDRRADQPEVRSCTAVDCGLRQRAAA